MFVDDPLLLRSWLRLVAAGARWRLEPRCVSKSVEFSRCPQPIPKNFPLSPKLDLGSEKGTIVS